MLLIARASTCVATVSLSPRHRRTFCRRGHASGYGSMGSGRAKALSCRPFAQRSALGANPVVRRGAAAGSAPGANPVVRLGAAAGTALWGDSTCPPRGLQLRTGPQTTHKVVFCPCLNLGSRLFMPAPIVRLGWLGSACAAPGVRQRQLREPMARRDMVSATCKHASITDARCAG